MNSIPRLLMGTAMLPVLYFWFLYACEPIASWYGSAGHGPVYLEEGDVLVPRRNLERETLPFFHLSCSNSMSFVTMLIPRHPGQHQSHSTGVGDSSKHQSGSNKS